MPANIAGFIEDVLETTLDFKFFKVDTEYEDDACDEPEPVKIS
jgi:hypothetical protein